MAQTKFLNCFKNIVKKSIFFIIIILTIIINTFADNNDFIIQNVSFIKQVINVSNQAFQA